MQIYVNRPVKIYLFMPLLLAFCFARFTSNRASKSPPSGNENRPAKTNHVNGGIGQTNPDRRQKRHTRRFPINYLIILRLRFLSVWSCGPFGEVYCPTGHMLICDCRYFRKNAFSYSSPPVADLLAGRFWGVACFM